MRASECLGSEPLRGRKTNKEWHIVKKVGLEKDNTPNGFSVGYIVKSAAGEEAFLKATDTNFDGTVGDPFTNLQQAIAEHSFERDILDVCQGNNMDRIVSCIDNGEHYVAVNGVRNIVFFLIFELAKGDARNRILDTREYDFGWAMHALHNLAVAIQQLHRFGVNHNDVKPANLLEFDEELQKLADLGRATSENILGPYDRLNCAGDPRYAPPEIIYVAPHTHRKVAFERRASSDLYLLGSVAYYFVTGQMMTPTMLLRLDKFDSGIHPRNWQGTFDEALPFWKKQFGLLLEETEATLSGMNFIPLQSRELLLTSIRQLCEPDPAQRGFPMSKESRAVTLDVQRYVAIFNLLRERSSHLLRRAVAN